MSTCYITYSYCTDPSTSLADRVAINKQLNDMERVAAALENPNLLEKVDLCLSGETAM